MRAQRHISDGPDRPLPAVTVGNAVKLLEQQMYLWGRDVLSPWGNLLVARGARTFRREDRRHDVRCYEFGTDDGTVLLHSTGVEYHFRVEDGRLEAAGAGGAAGLAYLRPHHRAFVLPAGGSVLPCRPA